MEPLEANVPIDGRPSTGVRDLRLWTRVRSEMHTEQRGGPHMGIASEAGRR
jgi:hypothetical protein